MFIKASGQVRIFQVSSILDASEAGQLLDPQRKFRQNYPPGPITYVCIP